MNKANYSRDISEIVSQFSEQEFLHFLENHCNMSLDDELAEYMRIKREQILKRYNIWHSSDGFYKVKIIEDGKKKTVSRKTREDIENFIINWEKEHAISSGLDEDCTLLDIFPHWIKQKRLELGNTASIAFLEDEWRRYYMNDPIIDVSLRKITKARLTTWIYELIDNYNLTKKAYYNISTIFRNCWQYAVDDELVQANLFSVIKVNKKRFKPTQKPDHNVGVYLKEERNKLTKHAYKRFEEDTKQTCSLVIPFLFESGLRIGEVAAVKFSDVIDEDGVKYLRVMRSDVKKYVTASDGKQKYAGRAVVEHVKTEAGIRNVPLTDEALKILDMAKQAQKEHKYHDDDYVFLYLGKRVTPIGIDKRLRRFCKEAGIPAKSAHKIRKFYVSNLIENGVNIDYVREIVGHEDINTTLNIYNFNTDDNVTAAKSVINAINKGKAAG